MSDDFPKTKEEFAHKVCGLETEEDYKLAVNPQIADFVLAELDKHIKYDTPVKLSVFFTGISAFLKEPINLFQKGESGIGKSYNTIQALKYLPADTKVLLGGLSPKALIHDYGVLLTEDGGKAEDVEKPEKPNRRDFSDDEEFKYDLKLWKQKTKDYFEVMRKTYTLIELSKRTLVFLETPEYEAFRMLYPILSHDTERIEYRFVDKPNQGQMRTMHVIIKGWPATIFLTVDKRYMEELATRSFTVTPENSKVKIEAANQLTNQKNCYPHLYQNETVESARIKTVLSAIKEWFEDSEADVIIPFEDLNNFFPTDIVRDMRDFQHFMQFLKTITALHLFQRPLITIGKKTFVVSTLHDVALALSVYLDIFETTRTGTEQAILSFYHSIVKQKNSWYLKELTEEYNLTASRKASSETIRVKLDRLGQIGYVDVEKDMVDKRLNVYTPLVTKDEISTNPLKTLDWLDFNSKMKEGFEKWLKTILKMGEANIKKFFLYVETEKKNLTPSDLRDEVLSEDFFIIYKGVSCRMFSKPELSPEQETKPSDEQTEEIRGVLDISQVKELVRLTGSYGLEKCACCEETKKAEWQVNLFGGSWGLLCGDCGYKIQKEIGKI